MRVGVTNIGVFCFFVEYVVFDEADRLFEMGFGEQLNETLHRLPDSKQMVMFSATLPKLLVDFARAGLGDPVLIRLGWLKHRSIAIKQMETLKCSFIFRCGIKATRGINAEIRSLSSRRTLLCINFTFEICRTE